MNKLLYISPEPIDIEKLSGVAKKILNQLKAFSKSFDTNIIYRNGTCIYTSNFDFSKTTKICDGKSKIDILNAAKKAARTERFDRVYIRYPMSDMYFIQLLRQLKKTNAKIVVEIPTFPYDCEGKETLRGRIVSFFDKLYRRKLRRYVDRIITYSDDDEIFNIPTIKTINGIDFDNIALIESMPTDDIHLCAVSGMYVLHGYDRLIMGLHNYYRSGGGRKIVFDVVGEGNMDDYYKSLVSKYQLEDKVKFYGKLFGADLEQIYEMASIGVNSLAIHRQGLKKESTLKSREYAAKGLPIISSSYIDALSDGGNQKYVFAIPSDDSAVDIRALIAFYDNIYEGANVKDIRMSIREDAIKICDMQVTLKPVVKFLSE